MLKICIIDNKHKIIKTKVLIIIKFHFMNLSPQLRIDITKIAVITICYILINIFIAFHNQGVYVSPLILGVSETYDFIAFLVISVLIGLLIGLLGGSVLVFVNYKLFQNKSFCFASFTTLPLLSTVVITENSLCWSIPE